MAPNLVPLRSPATVAPRAVLREALLATVETAPSRASAAMWFGVDVATLRRWLSGETRMDVEAILRSRRLAPRLLDELAQRAGAKGN